MLRTGFSNFKVIFLCLKYSEVNGLLIIALLINIFPQFKNNFFTKFAGILYYI